MCVCVCVCVVRYFALSYLQILIQAILNTFIFFAENIWEMDCNMVAFPNYNPFLSARPDNDDKATEMDGCYRLTTLNMIFFIFNLFCIIAQQAVILMLPRLRFVGMLLFSFFAYILPFVSSVIS